MRFVLYEIAKTIILPLKTNFLANMASNQYVFIKPFSYKIL
jgi:hypothetical protein